MSKAQYIESLIQNASSEHIRSVYEDLTRLEEAAKIANGKPFMIHFNTTNTTKTFEMGKNGQYREVSSKSKGN